MSVSMSVSNAISDIVLIIPIPACCIILKALPRLLSEPSDTLALLENVSEDTLALSLSLDIDDGGEFVTENKAAAAVEEEVADEVADEKLEKREEKLPLF